MELSQLTYKSSIDRFLTNNPPLGELYGDEIHLFMHCHMKGYDRTGEGKILDGSFFDKYGAPIHLQDFWMEGYHAIERQLADHFTSTKNPHIKFPPVAGYAGGTHLYGKIEDHTIEPWNWTGWIPRWRKHTITDYKHPRGRPLCNRFFMAFRGNEIQNDYWDYHPCDDEEFGVDGTEFDPEQPLEITNDKYRGGYFYKGNSWGRYLHINTIKSHERDKNTSYFKRYNYIVHPLAYRICTNRKPDCTVDGIQWCILNIVNEPHFGNPNEWGEKCHGLEIFNDFTYFHSYNPEYQFTPFEEPDFTIPCHNGEQMNTLVEEAEDYVWWFDTYPLEYAEFLLDTALSRGVYLDPLASNDCTYDRNTPLADYQRQIATWPNCPDLDDRLNRDSVQEDALKADPKGKNVRRMSKKLLLKLRKMKEPKTEDEHKRKGISREFSRLSDNDFIAEEADRALSFLNKLPYKDDTAFGYTTLIDPKRELQKMVIGLAGPDGILGTADDIGSLDDASMHAMDYLIDGRHFSHLGVYGLFNYHVYDEKFPIEVNGQVDKTRPCYQMTDDMELIFTFMPCKKEFESSFTHAPNQFVWKYAMQLEVSEGEEQTIHGYFNLDDSNKTRLDLTNYNKKKMKWIRFTCFEPASPQQRAWFLPIRGLAFGSPRNLIPRQPEIFEHIDNPPKMKHHIAIIENIGVIEEDAEVDTEDKEKAGKTFEVSVKCLREADAYFDKIYAVESKQLKFYFDTCTDREEENIYAYYLQVCPNQQDKEQLKRVIPKIEDINDLVLPPRILQSVHGLLELNNHHPTRLDLSNNWDMDTVIPSGINVDGEHVETGSVVYFYAIDSETFNPIEINPKPCPVIPTYDKEALTCSLTKLEHKSWTGST